MTDLGHGKDLKFVKLIEPSTPLEYSGTATIATDNQLATVEYVNDHPGASAAIHEILTISTPGQTSFTLSSTPVNADRSMLDLNGQTRLYGALPNDFTIAGTTLTWNDPGGVTLLTADELQIWYNITIAAGHLDQAQIYYVAKAGGDTNDGKSVNSPFLTIAKAITEVNLQTPSVTNPFKIQIIDAGIYAETITLPTYTVLEGLSAGKVTGTVTLSAGSRNLTLNNTNDTQIVTSAGNITLDAIGNKISLQDSAAGEIFTNVGFYPKWTNTPLLSARTSGVIPNVTGLGQYTVVFDNDIVNVGGHYNNTTGLFSFNVTGYYLITASITLLPLADIHNRLTAFINASAGIIVPLSYINPGAVRRNPGVTDDFAFSGGAKIKGFNGGGVDISVAVGGGVSNTVGIGEDSWFAVYFLGAA